MRRAKGYLLALMVLVTCPMWHSPDAMINAGGGMWCDDDYIWDGHTLQQVLFNCTWMPPFPYFPEPPPEPPIGGGNGAPYSPTAPFLPSSKIACAGEAASTEENPKRWGVTVVQKWAFVLAGVYGYSTTSPVPPPGYDILAALNHNVTINGQLSPDLSYTELFRAGYSAMSPGMMFHYNDPVTGQAGSVSDLDGDQVAVFVIGHEYAHQNGVADEPTASGYGARALEAYNATNRPCR